MAFVWASSRLNCGLLLGVFDKQPRVASAIERERVSAAELSPSLWQAAQFNS